MNIFLKIGELIFKILAIYLIGIALILEYISNMSKKTKKECKHDKNKITPHVTRFKQTQTY